MRNVFMPRGKATLGIETSYYRQEKKIIMISLLAASEKEIGQAESLSERKVEMWFGT